MPNAFKMTPSAYRHLPWIYSAKDVWSHLLSDGEDISIATKIPNSNSYVTTKNLQCWEERVLITLNKGTLGNTNDVMVDYRLHKERRLIHSFWTRIVSVLKRSFGVFVCQPRMKIR